MHRLQFGSCSECVSGTTTKYKLDTCNSGYAKVNDTCVKAYASCEAAGYLTSEPTNGHCTSTHDIYLTNGTQKTCYSACSCNDGYVEDASGQCVSDCSDYTLTECVLNGICSECNGKYKLDSCKEGTALYEGQCVVLCSRFEEDHVILGYDEMPSGTGAYKCLDNSTIKFAYKPNGVWIRRTENSNGGYSYRCTTTVGDGSKIEYILSGPYGNCHGDIRRGTCNGSTLNINVNGEVRLCSLYPVVDYKGQKNRCALFNYNSTAGIFNANLDYGNKATVAINPDTVFGEDKVQCVINGSSTVEVTFNY